MADVTDNIIKLTSLVEKLNSELDAHVDKLDAGAQAVNKYNKEFAKVPSEYVKVLSTAKNTVDSLEKSTSKMVMTAKQMEAQSYKESQARNALNKQRETSIKQMEREQARLEASQNLYNKVQTKLNTLSTEYKNLATRKELGLALTQKEEQRYSSLQARIQNYDKVLKGVDATMGKHQRNVGNYALGFNPLSNSINQLSREMPAFANSVQTGFMAISNNLPIFFDAMGNIIAQNKELQAQGLPTKSVLSQIASSLFSFQTLLSVGVTLLTVYGKEIVTWVSSLWGASDALNELNSRQKEFNKARFEGKKDAQSDIIELKKYLAVYNDVSLSIKDREIAYKKISQQYPYYIKNVQDATIANGKYSEGVSKLLVDLEKQKGLERETALQVKNEQKLKDLEKELDTTKKLETAKEKALKTAVKNNLSSQGLATISTELSKIQEKRIKLEKDINFYQEAINQNQIDIIRLTKERIGLEDTLDKQENNKENRLIRLKKLNQELADYAKSEYDLEKKRLENLKDNNKKIADDESSSLSDRIDSYNRYLENKRALGLLEKNRSLEVISKEFEDETKTINDKYTERLQEIKDAENDKNSIYVNGAQDRKLALEIKENEITALNKKVSLDRNLVMENFVQFQKDLADEYETEVVYKLLQSFDKLDKRNEISQDKLNKLRNRNFTGTTLDYKAPLTAFKEYYEDKNRIEEESRIANLESDINFINKRLLALGLANKTESEEYKKLIEQKIGYEIQLQEFKDASQEKNLRFIEEQRKKLTGYFEQFQEGFLSGMGLQSLNIFFKIEENGKTSFQNLLDTAKKTGKEMEFTFLAVSNVAQEVFNKIAEVSQANFEAEYERLDKQTETAIGFAGKNEKAKEAIEKQSAEKRKQIQRREWKTKHDLTMANIVMDTAQAVVATLAYTPPPLGTPLAIAMGALGAAQLAIVASQKMPQFWMGGTHEGGLMMVNDGKGSDYKETIVTPDGKIEQPQGRNVVMNKPKGTKIFTGEQWREVINKELAKNGISPMGSFFNFSMPTEIKGTDFSEVKQEISKLADVIRNKESVSINIDEAGFRTNIGGATVLNSRQKFIKKSV